jgi:hypothetical protein
VPGLLIVAAGAVLLGAGVGLVTRLGGHDRAARAPQAVGPLHWVWFLAAPPLAMYLSATATWLLRDWMGIRNYAFGSWGAALVPLTIVSWVPFLILWAISARVLRPDAPHDPIRSRHEKRVILGAGLAAGLLGVALLVEQGIASGNPPLDAIEFAILGSPVLVGGIAATMGLGIVGASVALGLTARPLDRESSK